MKKHQIAATVGTLALVANLLLPNLAFGQNQDVGQDVGCPGAGTQIFAATPANTTLTALTAGTGGNTVDASIAASTVGSDHLLAITDTTSGGANGCTSVGGSVTASATNFVDPALPSGNDIQADKLRLVTTTNVTADAAYDALFPAATRESVDNITYSVTGSGPGDQHDVQAPQTVADAATAALATTANLNAYTLTDPAQNKFGYLVAIDVLRYCSPKNSTFGSGVALALEGVPATQLADNYTSTVTYTKSPLNCMNFATTTLDAALSSTDTTMTLAVDTVQANTMVSIGAEYVLITANNADFTYTIERAQLGSTAASYNTSTTVYTAGNFYAAALDALVDGGAVTNFVTLDNSNYQVGQTLILNDAGYEHVLVTALNQDGFGITVQRGVDGTAAVSHNAGVDIIAVSVVPR